MDFFSLYISAASDLRPEREVLAKAITEIPVSLGWQIKLSPIDPPEELDLDAIRRFCTKRMQRLRKLAEHYSAHI